MTGIESTAVAGIVGTIVFYYQGSPCVTFNQVTDPETLSTVVRTLNQRQSNVQIGDGRAKPKPVNLVQDDISNTEEKIGQQTSSLSCLKCGNNNPLGSKFCNRCGSPLSPFCSKCGHSNPSGAIFCGQCGSKLVQ